MKEEREKKSSESAVNIGIVLEYIPHYSTAMKDGATLPFLYDCC